MTTGRLAILALGIGGLLLATDETGPSVQITNTERLPFPAGGALHVKSWYGELEVEGWNEPEIELTAVRTAPFGSDESARSKLEKVRIAMERQGQEVTISTTLARGAGQPALDYRIRMPRDGSLRVDRGSGEVYVTDVAGDIRTAVLQGEISLFLPAEEQYTIDAKSKLGSVVSDFSGQWRRTLWLFGHDFSAAPLTAAHKVYLRAGFGDILVLKSNRPAEPRPLGQ